METPPFVHAACAAGMCFHMEGDRKINAYLRKASCTDAVKSMKCGASWRFGFQMKHLQQD